MNLDHSLTKIPPSVDRILFLIGQQLKIRRLLNGLQEAGLDDCAFEPHLDRLILAEMGLNDGNDETIEFYCRIIEKRSKRIKRDRKSVMKQSLKAYMELTAIKNSKRNIEP